MFYIFNIYVSWYILIEVTDKARISKGMMLKPDLVGFFSGIPDKGKYTKCNC